MSDPFALTEAPPPVTVPTRAHIHPARVGQTPFDAELLGRTGNGKVKIRMSTGPTFAVDRFRLYAVDKVRGQARRKLTAAEIDALPWLGAGPDPLTQPSAATAPPWRSRR
jgi:hypothetical protein